MNMGDDVGWSGKFKLGAVVGAVATLAVVVAVQDPGAALGSSDSVVPLAATPSATPSATLSAAPSVTASPSPSATPPPPTAAPTAAPSVVPAPPGTPKVTVRIVSFRTVLKYKKVVRKDKTLAKGRVVQVRKGRTGLVIRSYRVVLTDGKKTGQKLVSTKVRKPVTHLVRLGTKVKKKAPAKKCDPNYGGACVPIASDVDCAGGSGDGPKYVTGPVQVIGEDIYGLDGNDDGTGCE
jgi:hypothetical protein